MQPFLDNLKKSNFSDPDIEFILESGKKIKYHKGEIFSKQGDKCNKIGILQSGIFGGSERNPENEKRMVQFYLLPQNYLVVDYPCFLMNSISTQTIEALDECEVLEMDMPSIQMLQQKFPNFLHLEKMTAEEKYLQSQELVNMFQTANAKQKIELVKEKAPELLAKVPYSYLASFLGLHRNTFAEAMKKIW